MSIPLAAADQNYAWLGMVPVGLISIALIINISTLQTKDMNRRSCHATTLLFIALIIEAASWTVRGFGGGSETGVFSALIVASSLHVISAAVALWGIWEHRMIGKWPYGRRRATWGFWLNVFALIGIAAWFYLCTNPKFYKRIFE